MTARASIGRSVARRCAHASSAAWISAAAPKTCRSMEGVARGERVFAMAVSAAVYADSEVLLLRLLLWLESSSIGALGYVVL